MLSHDQITDLLEYIEVDKIGKWKGDKISFCCPIHHETHESAGIHANYVTPDGSLEHLQIYHCFSCDSSGNLVQLLQRSLPDEFPFYGSALHFIEKRYNVKIHAYTEKEKSGVKRYEDFFNIKNKRYEQSLNVLAPFRSGKETYEYFYNRGFSKEVVRKFKIGRDLKNETVTVPIFWGDNKLCGVIGRYIDPNRPSNYRFKIYDFPKGDILFPLNHFKPNNRNEVILVEGLFDAIYMHMLGYSNTLTTFTASITIPQKHLLEEYGDTVIDLLDNDKRGREGAFKIKNSLSNKIRWKSVEFPSKGKDPCDWNKEDINKMLTSLNTIKIRRY